MNDSVFDNGTTAEGDARGLNMRWLETRVPPPIVAALIGAAAWWLSLVTPLVQVPMLPRVIAAFAIALVGGLVAMGAGAGFRRAKTTVNPLSPHTASTLVTAGIYRYTRNPMYLGLLLAVVAWAVFLASPFALAGAVAFVAYISRFQIGPEERALAARFGAEYTVYQARVRRWI